MRVRAKLLSPEPLLRTAAMRTEEQRARLGREEPSEGLGELELLLLVKEVEKGRSVYS